MSSKTNWVPSNLRDYIKKIRPPGGPKDEPPVSKRVMEPFLDGETNAVLEHLQTPFDKVDLQHCSPQKRRELCNALRQRARRVLKAMYDPEDES